MGAVAAAGGTLGEGDIFSLPPDEGAGPEIGILKSAPTIFLAQTREPPYWARGPNTEVRISGGHC